MGLALGSFKLDGFLIALVAAVVLAILWPEPGVSGGFLHADLITTYGISVVFFLYGLTLAPERMRAGLAKWRVHLVVQLATFALFPLVVLAALIPLHGRIPIEVELGFVYLAVLPGTISSSVAMTSHAGGNVAVAIFNATLTQLLAVLLTPLLMAWYMSTAGHSMPLGPVILKIALLVVAPIVLGQLLHKPLRQWTERNRWWIKIVDRAVIIVIVYNSFSDSVVAGVWTGHDMSLVLGIIVAAILLFFVIFWLVKLPCRWLGFDRADRIACLFCASKKSVATGVPLAKVVFGANPALGLIIAPLMIFHFFQLIIVSIIANRYAREVKR